MAAGYAQLDVLVLPSHTTPTWKEQFGRVIVEALWCGVPVVGSDSGEIPWLIGLTGGGLVFPEGDSEALARQPGQAARPSPSCAGELAGTGRRPSSGCSRCPAPPTRWSGCSPRAARASAQAAGHRVLGPYAAAGGGQTFVELVMPSHRSRPAESERRLARRPAHALPQRRVGGQ